MRIFSAGLLLLANAAFVSCKDRETDAIETVQTKDTVTTFPQDTIITSVHMDDSIDDGI